MIIFILLRLRQFFPVKLTVMSDAVRFDLSKPASFAYQNDGSVMDSRENGNPSNNNIPNCPLTVKSLLNIFHKHFKILNTDREPHQAVANACFLPFFRREGYVGICYGLSCYSDPKKDTHF